MNKLRPITGIGSPYHGLCYNDVYELGPTPHPTVSTTPAGATFGPAIPIIHPNAPGGSKLHIGSERSYGTYVGHTRSINGTDGGVGIGWNRWLYCDPVTDATWLMRLEHTDNTSDVDLEVWCDGVFGRFGRQYTSTPRLVQSFTWTPDIPSWAGGADTAENAVSQLLWDNHTLLAISPDGADVYLHMTTSPGGVSGRMYLPTNATGHDWGLLSGLAVCSIVKISTSGSSSAEAGGAAITATIAKDLAYEGEMVTYFNYAGGVCEHTSILYKTHEGTCTRTYTYTLSTRAFTVNYNLWGSSWGNSGTAVSAYGSGTEFKVYAQNAIYVATYKVYDATYRIFDQRWTALDWSGAVEVPYTTQTIETWTAPSSGYHEMPYTRKWVAAFAPFNPTGTFIVGDAVYLTTYTGTTYQYI